MPAAMAIPRPGEAPDRTTWLVCLGVTRWVRRGVVVCPIRGQAAVTDCQACHLLEAVEHEWRGMACEVVRGP
jgi:hypothetical protein